MRKKELVDFVAEHRRMYKRDVERVLTVAFATIGASVKRTGRFSWPAFGVWQLRNRKARLVVNPQSKVVQRIGPSKTIGFRPAKSLKARL